LLGLKKFFFRDSEQFNRQVNEFINQDYPDEIKKIIENNEKAAKEEEEEENSGK